MSNFRSFSFDGLLSSGGPFPLEASSGPLCSISLASAGRMKTGRDEANRRTFFTSLGIDPSRLASVSQVHSKTVYAVEDARELAEHPAGDGVITVNPDVVPCVTVADCMPIYLHDPVSGCFGVLHSGWKGTGIVGEALALASRRWGARAEDFYVLLGPHIRECCYTVDAERADYFTRGFGASCVTLDRERERSGSQWPWRLSLAEANRLHCVSVGIPSSRVADSRSCTSCGFEYGSSRREGADSFTHMAAFIALH